MVPHRNGLELPADLAPEQWHEIGERLAQATAGALFMWGDFFAYGERFHGVRKHKGESPYMADGVFETWAPRTGFEANTLRNAKCVCLAVPLSRRRDNVPFSHLQEIVGRAPANQIDHWQEKVAYERLSRVALRRQLRLATAKFQDDTVPPVKTFLGEAQRFAAAYRTASGDWHPNFKREVAKLLKPVFDDLGSALRDL